MFNFKYNTDCKFQPVQCTSETFQTLDVQEGYVYFVTDTKKLYIGKNGKKVPMCSSSKFFYGIKNIEYDNSGILPDPNVVFSYAEIENDNNDFPSIPEENDLILNIDGCFYRVMKIAEDGLETKRLTLQGTGTGGNTPGGPDTPASGSFSIQLKDNIKNKVYSSTAATMPVYFTGYYNGTNVNNINHVEFRLSDNEAEEPFYRADGPFSFNIEQSIDLKNCQNVFNKSAKTKIYMYVYDLYGASRYTYLTIQLVDFILSSTNDNIIISRENNNKNTIIYSYNWTGITTDGLGNKELNFALYEENNLFNEIKTFSQKNLSSEEGSYELDISDLNNNVYVLKVKGSAMINADPLPTNELIHKVVCYKTGANPLLAIHIPEKTEQYTNIPIEYNLTAAADINKKYAMKFSISGDEIANINVRANADTQTYNLYFDNSGKYAFNASINSLGIAFTTDVEIKEYSSKIPVIENRADLKLHLNPRNKSNNDIDRNLWIDKKNNQTAELSNFYYGNANGWSIDEEGVNYLNLTSGAKLEVPNFRPFENDIKSKGLTIELDFEINGVLDYNAELISCLSKGSTENIINTGFVITGEKAKFYKLTTENVPLLSLNLVEGRRTRISFTIESSEDNQYPMAYAFIDGKISGAKFYGEQASFIENINKQAIIKVDSTSAQIKIYSIRVYNSALSDKIILNNYIASFGSNEEKIKEYQDNNVYDTNNNIDFNKVNSNTYDIQIPYMVLTGGYATKSSNIWQRESATASDNSGRLPIGKEDYRLVDVKVHYPKNVEYFNGYEDYEFINTFANGKSMKVAYDEEPINGGAIMYAQGTSSMEYPIKNLRLRFKNSDNWYKVKSNIAPVEIICMKADYMESSGSHNTGAANLIDQLYSSMGLKTPPQEHYINENIVTCIKGYPCLIFYSDSGEQGDYQYIGKYNLNLDKATPEPFGFKHDDTNFGKLDNGENAIHCFEFLDNAVEVCNFKNKYKNYIENKETGELEPDPNGGTETFEDTWYKNFKNKKGKMVPGWTLGFESRYPEDKKGKTDADSLYPLANWLNNLYNMRYGLNGVEKNEDRALKLFRSQYECHFNKRFLLTYYLITEALLMADSRVKNMMIATWGKEERTYIDIDTGLEKKSNNYIFYPIFYDMDTMLGLDNTGVHRFNYYDEDTNPNIFNGDEVLWTFVRDTLQQELNEEYANLENAGMRANNILPYFNKNQANLANEAFYNGDAKYKYINPALKGYHDDLYDKEIPAGKGPYLYAAQGDRETMREQFIKNRINFLRGKRASGDFYATDRIVFRYNAPANVGEDGFKFKFTSLRPGYAGVSLGANVGSYVAQFSAAEQIEDIAIPNADSANGTEAYILGVSNLSSLGDLSSKYVQKFIVETNDFKIKELTLGSGKLGYSNPHWKGADSIDLTKAILLEEFNLFNCADYQNSLNFTNCHNIQRILLTGSGVNELYLPISGAINELRLPTSIPILIINSHPNLKQDNFSIGTYTYGSDELIGGNGIYNNDYTNLQEIRIINTPIDTYEMVRNTSDDMFQKYYLPEVNWIINDINKTSSPADGDPLLNEDDIIQCIPILDYLFTKKPVDIDGEVNNSADALTGKIEINIDAKVNEFDIYNKYISKYPNLTIIYGDKIKKTKANRIYIYPNTNYSENIDFENEYYEMSLLSDSASLLGVDFVNVLPIPIMASTNELVYEFSGEWVDYYDNKKSYWDDRYIKPSLPEDDPEKEKYDNMPLLSDFQLTEDKNEYHFIPVFKSRERLYTVHYYNNLKEYSWSPIQYKYNTLLKDVEDSFLKSQLRYQYLECNEEHYRYDLQGWISQVDYENKTENPTIYNIDEFRVVSDNLRLYTYFKKVDCRQTISPDVLFDIQGNTVSLNDQYVALVQGKLTLPGGHATIGNCKASNLTHIYVPQDYTAISNESFTNSEQLKYIYLPDTIETIGDRAFYNCSNLIMTELPKNIKTVGTQSFLNGSKVDITDFSQDKYPDLTLLEFSAFRNTGSESKAIKITIPSNVKLGHFSNANENEKYATFAGGYNNVANISITLANQTDSSIYNDLSSFVEDVMGRSLNTSNVTYEEIIN